MPARKRVIKQAAVRRRGPAAAPAAPDPYAERPLQPADSGAASVPTGPSDNATSGIQTENTSTPGSPTVRPALRPARG
jgi:hypothetical protein